MNEEFYKIGDLIYYSGKVWTIVSKQGRSLFCKDYASESTAILSALVGHYKLVRVKSMSSLSVGECVIWVGFDSDVLNSFYDLRQGEKYIVLRNYQCFSVIKELNTDKQEIVCSANLLARIVPYEYKKTDVVKDGFDTSLVGTMPNYLNTENSICTYVSNKMEETKMDETIKMYNAKNLKEAKRQAEEEKANLEVMRAKQVYKSLINTKEMHEREIKIRQEEIKKIELELAVFDKK